MSRERATPSGTLWTRRNNKAKDQTGVLLLLQACTPSSPCSPLLKKTIHTAAQTFPFIFFFFFFWLLCVLLSSGIKCLLRAAGGSRCIFVKAQPQIPSFLWWFSISGTCPGAIEPCGDRHYSLIEIPAIRNVSILSITVPFECIVFMCHDFKKHLAAVPVNACVWVCYVFSLSSSPQNFFQIISNLLEEENKEKWEDAQKVSMLAVHLVNNSGCCIQGCASQTSTQSLFAVAPREQQR